MRFVQLEEKLKKEFFPVLLVEGDDAFLREKAVETVCASLNVAMPELNITVLREPSVTELERARRAFRF